MHDVYFVVCNAPVGPARCRQRHVAVSGGAHVIHLIRNSFRYASSTYWDELSRDLRPIYTAKNEDAALPALDALHDRWGARYTAMIRLWRNAWIEFAAIPGLRRGDPNGHLPDECDRVTQRPLPASGQGPRSLPEHPGCDEDPVPGHPDSRPQGHRTDQVGHALEASTERIRDNLRRSHAGGTNKRKPPPPPSTRQTPWKVT